jgi:hypothetical protein
MLQAGIFPPKRTQQKVMESSKINKSHEPIKFVFLALWEGIISYKFFMASTRMFRNFIFHNPTHKNPLPIP